MDSSASASSLNSPLIDPKPSPPPLYGRAVFCVGTLASILLALFSYRYVLGVGFVAPPILANSFFPVFLALHVAGAATALLLGPFQFLKSIRSRHLRIHRISGRIYALACLVGGLAAFPLSWGVTSGPIAASGFGVLAVLWLAVTGNAVRLAIDGRVAEHREWMLRSFALTFAAVTFRLSIAALPRLGMTFETGYIISTWTGWVFNPMLAELYIRYTRSQVVKPLSVSEVTDKVIDGQLSICIPVQ